METAFFVRCIFEFLGSFVLMLLGCGVVACVNLTKSKGVGGGWITITLAWGLAVMCGVLIAGPYSGAHLNPAVSVGLAAAGKFPWSEVFGYVVAQIFGGFVGGVATYIFYKDHFDVTDDKELKLAIFCTGPAIRNYRRNLVCEILGTFVLVFVILYLSEEGNIASLTAADGIKSGVIGLGTIGALPVSLLVVVIGMSLGGTTGYAINPARDLGPRLAHAAMPIKDKRDSDWSYSWIPIVGPLIGGVTAAVIFWIMKSMM